VFVPKSVIRLPNSFSLLSGTDGLGFTVTSKDFLTSQQRTFFIKNVLGKGAAIKDGRLKANDQLLSVRSHK